MSGKVSLSPEEAGNIAQETAIFAERLAEAGAGETPEQHVVLQLAKPEGRERYEAILGELAQGPFSDAFETLMSFENVDVETLQAAGRSKFGACVIEAFQKRICGDPELKEKLKKLIGEANQAGYKITTPTATGIMVGISTAVVIIVSTAFAGPLAVVMAPLAGGVALFIMQVGVDAFCLWNVQQDVPDGSEKPA